jgi:hypothetical protein
MNIFKPKYDTYQDVKDNLAWWSTFLFLILEIILFALVLTPNHRHAILNIPIPGFAQWLNKTGFLAALFIIALILAQVLVHIAGVHDKFYDRYFVQWRRRYDSHFIIPKLLKPYHSMLSPEFEAAAQGDIYKSMRKLFYDFVQDRDCMIAKNLVVRFYEKITLYWLCQMVEFCSLTLFVCSVAYWAVGYFREWPSITFPIQALMCAAIGGIVGRLLSHSMRLQVKRATEDEIDAIHTRCKQAFEESLTKYSHSLGLKYGKD